VTSCLFALCIAAFGTSIWFSEKLRRLGADKELCTSVSVVILDSAENRLVTPESVCEMLSRIGDPVGLRLSDLNVYRIEQGITAMGAVKKTDAAVDRNGLLHIIITQRHPILRFQRTDGGYYMDDTGFCFPLSDLFTPDVPVITGDIRPEDLTWNDGMLELGRYLDGHPYWHTQIEQINVLPDGTLQLWSRTSHQTIRFGLPDKIESKFDRLSSFYNDIAPNYGWDYYSVIDLNYTNQIVCTRAHNTHDNK